MDHNSVVYLVGSFHVWSALAEHLAARVLVVSPRCHLAPAEWRTTISALHFSWLVQAVVAPVPFYASIGRTCSCGVCSCQLCPPMMCLTRLSLASGAWNTPCPLPLVARKEVMRQVMEVGKVWLCEIEREDAGPSTTFYSQLADSEKHILFISNVGYTTIYFIYSEPTSTNLFPLPKVTVIYFIPHK